MGTDLVGARIRDLKGIGTQILAGTCGAYAGVTVGARTRIQAHANDKGTSVGIV